MEFTVYQSRMFGRICYGFERNKNGIVSINEAKSQVVKNIFDLYLNGYSIEKIQAKLFEQSVLSPSGKNQWTRDVIHKVLNNAKYIRGIIKPEDFIEVQYMLDSNCRNIKM